MDPSIVVALIGLLGLAMSGTINAWVLVKISKIQTNVQKVETATNSMKDELVRLSHAEGVTQGRDAERAKQQSI